MGLGVGTKFLSADLLRAEEEEAAAVAAAEEASEGGVQSQEPQQSNDQGTTTTPTTTTGLDNIRYRGYGRRVRDCHAEVLARRSFRRQLLLEIHQHQMQQQQRQDGGQPQECVDNMDQPAYRQVLERIAPNVSLTDSVSSSSTTSPLSLTTDSSDNSTKEDDSMSVLFRLKDGVTLHMYSSSAPCGNSTLKKFATMERERFQDKLGPDEWLTGTHDPIGPHSLRLGQFALLVKKDVTATDLKHVNKSSSSSVTTPRPVRHTGKPWPARESDDWCPPGTSTVWTGRGSIHTCSDKICRWNCLGLQGSLLASLIESPLYMTSLTVGRKFTSAICRRAVCCRALPKQRKNKKNHGHDKDKREKEPTPYKLNHPAVMGTAVYLDDTGASLLL